MYLNSSGVPKRQLGAIAEYPVEIEAGWKGLASTRQVSSVAGSLNEAICYVLATRGYASRSYSLPDFAF